MFFYDSQNLSSIYSSQNIVFESPSDEFTLTCSGIAGDRSRLLTVFELKSNGDFCFDPEESYFIGEWGIDTTPLNLNGYSISFRGKFPKLINSSEVVSVAFDDFVLFTA